MIINNSQTFKFPIGYHDLHPDTSLNFQMNRWYNWVGDDQMLIEMRAVVPRIISYQDFTHQFLMLAGQAETNHQNLKRAFYLRAAEFFMFPDDPAKQETRESFLKLIRQHFGLTASDRILVPYDSGMLSAYCFSPDHPKGTIVVFGGFDSYIEEWFAALFTLRDAGYKVVAFDGPGQGAALEDYQLSMTFAWERPVKAILDYFQLDDVTLMGFSLGGGFVLRAAAFEPRVRRVIADDVLTDFFEVTLRQLNRAARTVLRTLVYAGAEAPVNALLRSAMKSSLVAEWGIQEGMHVTGSKSPYAFLRAIINYQTAPISRNVHQDVLLMAGAEDHYVPLQQFTKQIQMVSNVRSLTTRLFTRAENAQNHCQIGNLGLSLRVIINWIDEISQPSFDPRQVDNHLRQLQADG
jgi:pimeloyl-ACP methyl ester carboxylesterase